MNLQTAEIKSQLDEQPNQDDLDMLRLIDSYTAEARDRRQTVIEACGISPQRLALYNLGALSLSGAERALINQTLAS